MPPAPVVADNKVPPPAYAPSQSQIAYINCGDKALKTVEIDRVVNGSSLAFNVPDPSRNGPITQFGVKQAVLLENGSNLSVSPAPRGGDQKTMQIEQLDKKNGAVDGGILMIGDSPGPLTAPAIGEKRAMKIDTAEAKHAADMSFVTDDGRHITLAQLAAAWDMTLANLDDTAPRIE